RPGTPAAVVDAVQTARTATGHVRFAPGRPSGAPASPPGRENPRARAGKTRPPSGGRTSRRGEPAVRVEDVLAGGAVVELGVAARRRLERYRRGVDRLRDLDPVVQDRHLQPAVVAHLRALAGDEAVGRRPAVADADRQRAVPGGL